MATGKIAFDITADSSAALSSIQKTDAAVKELGKDAAKSAAEMTSAAKMEAAAWEQVATKIATAKMQAQRMQQSAGSNAGGGILSSLGSIGMAGMGLSAIKNSILSVGSAIYKISESTREYDTAVIKLRTGMGVTAEQAQGFGKALQETWRTGKSSMGELAETSRRLSEVMSADQAVEWTKLLEDYAVQTGTSVETLGTQLTKALQAGTVEGRDLKALAKDGIPIWDLLSQTMGKSREEVMALGTAGNITGADLQAALIKGRAAAQAFNDETAANSFETLSRTGSLAMQKLGAGINKGLRPALKGLINSSGELSSAWGEALEGIGRRIGELLAGLSKFAQKVASFIAPIKGSRYEYGPSMTKEEAKRLGFEDADTYAGAAWERPAEQAQTSSAVAITADPLAAKKKRLAAASSDAEKLDEKLADAYAQNREALAKQRLDDEYKKLADAELKQLADREKAWELNQKIEEESAALRRKMDNRSELRKSAEADAAKYDRNRNWIAHATQRQLDLYNRGKALGIDMTDPTSKDFKQVMRGFNPQSGKSFVQEDREQRIANARAAGRGVSLSAQGSLRERLAGRVISSHRDDAEKAHQEPYEKPLQTIGRTLETIAKNTETDPVAVFS